VPASAQWMARRYRAPSLTVIFDNQGWAAPVLSALAVHPSGATAAVGGGTGFAPEADLPGVAAAAGRAYAATVSQAAKLPAALGRALAHVSRGRSAVISVHVPSAAPPPAGPHRRAPDDPG
jgi:acetolactate synthase I/II/III large subunit